MRDAPGLLSREEHPPKSPNDAGLARPAEKPAHTVRSGEQQEQVKSERAELSVANVFTLSFHSAANHDASSFLRLAAPEAGGLDASRETKKSQNPRFQSGGFGRMPVINSRFHWDTGLCHQL